MRSGSQKEWAVLENRNRSSRDQRKEARASLPRWWEGSPTLAVGVTFARSALLTPILSPPHRPGFLDEDIVSVAPSTTLRSPG